MTRARAWRSVSLVVGVAAIAVALLSPLEAAAHDLFSAHMAQHLILIFVAAPLLVFGAPTLPVPRALTSVVGVWGLHVAALWAWHLPALYTSALYRDALHGFEHLTFLATAWLFWFAVATPDKKRRLPQPHALLLVFLTAVAGGALGAVLTFARTPLYVVHATGTHGRGLSLLEDQQLAGLVMWIPIGVVYLATACALFLSWMRSMDADATHATVER